MYYNHNYNKKEVILNKWNLELRFHKNYQYFFPGLFIFIIGFYKVTSLPEEGIMINKSNYKGFRLVFNVILPITNYN
jgi:hypothetical protein